MSPCGSNCLIYTVLFTKQCHNSTKSRMCQINNIVYCVFKHLGIWAADRLKYHWHLLNIVLHEINRCSMTHFHDEVIKWKHFLRYWPFVWGIHRSPLHFPHKGQWREALMVSLICGWVSNRDAGDLKRHCTHYNVTLMYWLRLTEIFNYIHGVLCGVIAHPYRSFTVV